MLRHISDLVIGRGCILEGTRSHECSGCLSRFKNHKLASRTSQTIVRLETASWDEAGWEDKDMITGRANFSERKWEKRPSHAFVVERILC